MTATRVTEPPLIHGGRLAAMRRAFPNAPQPWIDLSTGINPIPYPIPRLPAASFTRLPDPEATLDLEAAAAAAYGVTDPARVVTVAAPGSQSLIDLLPRLLRLDRVAVLGPTYAEHAVAWRRTGSAVTKIRTIDDLTDHAALIVCNPNNPDGRILPPALLRDAADRLAARGGWLVIDEAFADLLPEISMVPALPHPAIIVLRSFGKAYGLAGIRLGFALAPPMQAALIKAALGPWPVSGPALDIGRAALADPAWLATARDRLGHDAAKLDRLLTGAGMTVLGGTTLFRLAACPDAQDRFARCADSGIMIRRFETQPTWLRFGMPGTRIAWRRLDAALPSSAVRNPN